MGHDFAVAALAALERGGGAVLARIIAQAGSTPRTAGTRMLVAPGGAIVGTVGGGRYEAEAIRVAQAMLQAMRHKDEAGCAARIAHFSLAGVTDMDMICGGALDILLEPLPPGSAAATLCARRFEADARGKAQYVFSRLVFPESAFAGQGGTGEVRGTLRDCHEADAPADPDGPPPEVLREARNLLHGGGAARLIRHGEEHWLVEVCRAPSLLYLFGAGHVSRATASLAATVGFRTVVADDRAEFASPERFPASRLTVLPEFGAKSGEDHVRAFLARENPAPKDALLVLTRGHAHDRDVLRAALETRAGYIGMIGSTAKRDALYAALRQQGISGAALAAVHCPVGLAIGAQSPEEIAVSIVAELIAWRAKNAAALRAAHMEEKAS